jgi:methionyl-tRNA synthetase
MHLSVIFLPPSNGRINNNKDWQPYWLDKDTKLVHFIGKDNIVFHCIIFPVMLKLHGYIVPENVPANEFMNLEGDKMSTSRATGSWICRITLMILSKRKMAVRKWPMPCGIILTTILPETKDSEFTWKGFQDAVNGELVAIFANYFNRTFVLMHKLTGGKVPKFHQDITDSKDNELMAEIKGAKERIETCWKNTSSVMPYLRWLTWPAKETSTCRKKSPG